jgi:hypothetical protein
MILLTPEDPRLSFWSPQPVDRARGEARLDRFPAAVGQRLTGQIGPLANLRSSSGCAVLVRTDAPWVELHLDRLRHHQLVPVGVAAEILEADGSWRVTASEDLREREGRVTVRLATGLQRGEARAVAVWLPLISTCAVVGLGLPADAAAEPEAPPEPRWLAIGDSLTQGFSVQCPTQNWVHRVMRARDLPAWNLGVGGLMIEPEVVRWALEARRWDLVTIGLGSNHAWRESDAERAVERALALAEAALAGGHGRVLWLLPPYKPCEEGKGPAEFAGVPLDRAAGERAGRVRAALREALGLHAPRLEVVDDLGVRDHRFYPDGLHPFAIGFARYADQVLAALG